MKRTSLVMSSSMMRSHPSRGRGLKHRCHSRRQTQGQVAPFTGAWIETCPRHRGKKGCLVAPFTGAWIETRDHGERRSRRQSRRFTGAWIETRMGKIRWQNYAVAPSRGRGLKPDRTSSKSKYKSRRPFTGAWIETARPAPFRLLAMGRTLYGCVD